MNSTSQKNNSSKKSESSISSDQTIKLMRQANIFSDIKYSYDSEKDIEVCTKLIADNDTFNSNLTDIKSDSKKRRLDYKVNNDALNTKNTNNANNETELNNQEVNAKQISEENSNNIKIKNKNKALHSKTLKTNQANKYHQQELQRDIKIKNSPKDNKYKNQINNIAKGQCQSSRLFDERNTTNSLHYSNQETNHSIINVSPTFIQNQTEYNSQLNFNQYYTNNFNNRNLKYNEKSPSNNQMNLNYPITNNTTNSQHPSKTTIPYNYYSNSNNNIYINNINSNKYTNIPNNSVVSTNNIPYNNINYNNVNNINTSFNKVNNSLQNPPCLQQYDNRSNFLIMNNGISYDSLYMNYSNINPNINNNMNSHISSNINYNPINIKDDNNMLLNNFNKSGNNSNNINNRNNILYTNNFVDNTTSLKHLIIITLIITIIVILTQIIVICKLIKTIILH